MKDLECNGYGNVPAKVMFVGISAGRRGALVSKIPLTRDASGRIFQRCLKELGFSLSDEFSEKPILKNCYITNLVKGRCLTKDGLNRLPTIKEVERWWEFFVQEYKKVQPEVVVALGDFVYKKLRFLQDANVVRVKHPRWYQAHGALKSNSSSFKQMVRDYQTVISVTRS